MEAMMRNKKRLILTGLILCGASPALAALPPLTWGKAGVPYEAYRSDATDCLRVAVATDLSGTAPAEALVLASRRIAAALNADPYSVAEVTDMARPNLQIRDARAILQRRLDHCLVAHGYHRFRLSDAQNRRLQHFHLNQPERQVYLHSLASDPEVLARQTVPDEVTR
jgi:hypothetical protein